MSIKKRKKLFWKIFLGLFFCLIESFVWSHPQEFLSVAIASEDTLLKSSQSYGSCQKPTRFEDKLNSMPLNEAFKPLSMMREGPELFIFVSSSMPAQSLKQWAEQSEKTGGTLVLRGFIQDSPKKTVEWVMELFEDNTEGVTVDPERFSQFNIDKVPAVVISLPSNNESQPEENQKALFEIVYGDVPLKEALIALSQKGSREIREASHRFLARFGANLQ